LALPFPSSLHTHTHTHTHPFNGLLSRTTQVSRHQKGKPIWILLKQETVSGSGICWVICKSAPCSRQITLPAPHHSVFTGRMPFLPPNQQRQNSSLHLPAIPTRSLASVATDLSHLPKAEKEGGRRETTDSTRLTRLTTDRQTAY